MNTYLYIRKISLWRKIIGIVTLTIAVLLLLISPISALKFVGAFFTFFAGLYLVSTDGIEIKFKTNEFRSVFSVFSLNIGSWESYPKIDYISIVNQKVSQEIENKYQSLGASVTLKSEQIFINLFCETNIRKTIFRTNNMVLALDIAQHISSYYNVEIKNSL